MTMHGCCASWHCKGLLCCMPCMGILCYCHCFQKGQLHTAVVHGIMHASHGNVGWCSMSLRNLQNLRTHVCVQSLSQSMYAVALHSRQHSKQDLSLAAETSVSYVLYQPLQHIIPPPNALLLLLSRLTGSDVLS